MQQLLKYPEKTPENSHYLRWYDLLHQVFTVICVRTFPLMVAKNPRKQPKIADPPNARQDSCQADFRQVTDSQSLFYKF